jgi:DNA-binding transcriptional LysR family regulator
MDLRHLRSFVTVAQELSFRAAAKRLGMSQPPLSRQIKVLEEEVGVRLLERDRNRRVTLTDAGQTFLADAKRTLAAAEATLRHTREAANGARGRLNVANIAALSIRVVPPLLHLFRVLHPEVKVFMIELERTEQVAALREGRIHVGIYPDLCTPQDRQFQSQGLFACPMVAVLPPSHPDAGAENQEMELDIHALAKDTVLIPSPNYSPGYQERLEHTCEAAHFTPAATHPVEGMPNLLGMVTAGYGVALLPEVLVRGQVPACQVRRLGAPVPPFRLNLIWLRQSTSQILQNFLMVSQEVARRTDGLLF